jgi:hypothetical protein
MLSGRDITRDVSHMFCIPRIPQHLRCPMLSSCPKYYARNAVSATFFLPTTCVSCVQLRAGAKESQVTSKDTYIWQRRESKRSDTTYCVHAV